MSRIIVIGANHAGTACINTLTSASQDNEVIVYDRNNNISFLGCGMALWIGDQIGGCDGLFYSSKEKLEQNGAKVSMETEVTRIDFDQKKVYIREKNGTEKEDHYDKLVLATGSSPQTLHIPGSDLENIQLVKLFQNAQEVIQKIHRPGIEKIAVIGGGYIGVELAEAFERQGKKVVLIDRENTVLSGYYDDIFRKKMVDNLAGHGITMALGEDLVRFEGEGKVERVVTDKNTYDIDMVISCIGFRPNNELGKERLNLYENGAYLVNKKQQTSEPDVYAIGDCATVYDNATESTQYIALATNAVRSGIVAAYNILGAPIESLGVQGSSGICIYDLKMVSTGLTEEKAKKEGFDVLCSDFEDTQKPAFIETSNPKVTIRIVYEKNTKRVLGCQMASNYDMSMGIHMFSLAIQEKLTIDRIALLDIFFLPHFNQPYNYITMAALQALS